MGPDRTYGGEQDRQRGLQVAAAWATRVVGVVALCLVLAGCTGDAESDAPPAGAGEAATVESAGVVSYGRTSVKALGDSSQQLVVSAAEMSQTASSHLATLLTTGVVAGVPIQVEAPGTGDDAKFKLTRTYAAPVPDGVAATWAFYNEGLGTWQAVPSTLSKDRRTVTAVVDHLSWWDDLVSGTQDAMAGFRDAVVAAGGKVKDVAGDIATNAAALSQNAQALFTEGAEWLFWAVGALFDTRVDAPRCRGPVPDWVGDTVVMDDHPNNPIRWCVGHDVKRPELLVVKARVNRGFGYGFVTTAAPEWTYNSTDPDGTFDVLLDTVGSLDKTLSGSVHALMFGGNLVGPGKEVSFGFTEDEVRSQDPNGDPLVELMLPDAIGFLFSVAGELSYQQASMKAEGWVATVIAVASCTKAIRDRDDVAGMARALLTCLGTADEQIARTVATTLTDMGYDPRKSGKKAGTLVGRATVILAIVGPLFSSFNYFAERETASAARQAHIFPTVLGPTATTIVKVNPFLPTGQLRPGWTLDTSQGGYDEYTLDCADYGGPYPSSSALSPNTYSCGTTADNMNACWAPPTYPGQLVCLRDPVSKQLWTQAVTGVGPTPKPADPNPLMIELDDGSRWGLRIGGSWDGRADGWVGAYWCVEDTPCDQPPEYLNVVTSPVGPAIDTSQPFWTTHVGQLGDPREDFPAPEEHRVVKAWYIVSTFR